MRKMATKKNLTYSVTNASDEVIDNPCSFCLSLDKEVESVSYGTSCNVNMCRACRKEHSDSPATKSHKVVGVSGANRACKPRVPLPTQRCHLHPDKIIDMFCQDHQELCCDNCINMNHRTCSNKEYIPMVAKGIKKGKTLLAMKTSSQSVLKALQDLKMSQLDTLQTLDTAEVQCQQAIQNHRDKLVKRIDDMAKADAVKVYSKFQEEKDTVTKNIEAVDNQLDTLETITKSLDESKGNNESELFVYMKQGEKSEKDGKRTLRNMQQSRTKIPKYKFKSAIENSLDDVESLGDFEEAASWKPVKLKLRREFDVRAKSDESECHISGICYLPDATVILADNNNRSVKQLGPSHKVTRSLDMTARPWDLCYTTNNEVAVTLSREKKVQIVCVGVNLMKTRSFPVGSICRGIACNNGELFICCGDARRPSGEIVCVFSLKGKLLRSLQRDLMGQTLFTRIEYISISSCGNKLHVTDTNKGIITTDRFGNLVSSYTDHSLRHAVGICTLDNGDMLTCGHDTNNVLQVSRDGRKQAVVLGEKDGALVKPQALAFNSVNSVIISSYKSDKIKVYDVE